MLLLLYTVTLLSVLQTCASLECLECISVDADSGNKNNPMLSVFKVLGNKDCVRRPHTVKSLPCPNAIKCMAGKITAKYVRPELPAGFDVSLVMHVRSCGNESVDITKDDGCYDAKDFEGVIRGGMGKQAANHQELGGIVCVCSSDNCNNHTGSLIGDSDDYDPYEYDDYDSNSNLFGEDYEESDRYNGHDEMDQSEPEKTSSSQSARVDVVSSSMLVTLLVVTAFQ